jgi:hypothetical protein
MNMAAAPVMAVVLFLPANPPRRPLMFSLSPIWLALTIVVDLLGEVGVMKIAWQILRLCSKVCL